MLVSLHDFVPAGPGAPDLRPAYTVRTPRRRGSGTYVAQVWGDAGFWTVGTFPTTAAARRAARKFLATDPSEPAPGADPPANWTRRRSDSHAPRHKWVRRVKGLNSWQARPWLGAGCGSLNLGLFTFATHGESAEWAAAQVSRAFMREWRPGKTVGEVVELLKGAKKASERVPAHVTVPEHQRDLLPPRNFEPVPSPKRLREERAARLVTLADFLTAYRS